MTELGAYVERFETNSRSRALRGLAAMAIGAPIALFGIVLFLMGQEAGVFGGEMFLGLVIGCGLGLMLMGGWLCWQAVGKRGETFTLYERGFVHTWRRSTTIVPWDSIEVVVDHTKSNILAKTLGGDVGCVVKLADGRKILINGFTEGAAMLTYDISEAVRRRPV
ncbi:hypothetical protein [Amycolatopsis sp. BJA-103]|uniref:hypothetical protein n=1 Tax=unclassified Amycolatopsis TaxID=2618356 RepID=UPI000C771105|nr:hypothetical protein [Amycolatopsis sp. BJA-103]AUI63929.1 hypothetical protein BKN51_41115 [Amycolatopsis sp. BJA-103]PNE15957.1 hypothetical protein B1H26_26995 [Amycolatopsis sp. BJA-103]